MSQVEETKFNDDLTELIETIFGKDKAAASNAAAACQSFIQSYPAYSQGYYVLGIFSYLNRRVGDATEMISQAFEIDPEIQEYGLALSGLNALAGKLNDALYFAKVGSVGESDPLLKTILPPELSNFVIASDRAAVNKHYIQALRFFDGHQYQDALTECELELKMDASHEPTLYLYARIFIAIADYGRAISVLQKIISDNPDCKTTVLVELSYALAQLGLSDQAQQYMQEVLKRSNISVEDGCYVLRVCELLPGGKDLAKQVWAILNESHLQDIKPYYEYPPSIDGKIRVGILSDKFCDGFEGQALLAQLKRMDRSVFDVYGYIQNINRDNITTAIQNETVFSRKVYDINDKTLALTMKRDGIDFVIDMCGIGPSQRIEFIASQPGVKRISWLAPGYGLGQPGIDYVLSDNASHQMLSSNSDETQKCLLLENTLFSMPVIEGYKDVTPLPALKNNYITFGTRLDLAALSNGDGELWARVLQAYPNAKLRINLGEVASDMSIVLINQIFEPLGVQDQIDLHIADSDDQYGAFYDQVDIALLSRNISVGNLFEAMWMGVPVVMHTAHALSTQLCRSAIHGIGHKNWASDDEDSFIQQVKKLANDISYLSELRAGLRDHLRDSALMDMNAFTMELMMMLGALMSDDTKA
ncbi:MAG: hypothetical protein OQK24_14395 [Magnetovibrio sp.]|nr:hypothetical protein [Magnetovibrio sp.]